MIVFLTLCYLAMLVLLLKFKVIQPTLWWKISPVVWMLVLFVALFMPMQWGAPAGVVNTFQNVVEIVPNVTGQVTEVPVKPLQPVKKGDVLFKIETRPFQAALDQLEANIKLSKANLKRARQLYAKKLGTKVDVDKYTAEVAKLLAMLDAAKYDLESTVVRAPDDGYVVGLSLRPGHRVAQLPMRSYMSFVISNANKIAIGISQNALRHVRTGQPAEVTFKLIPGKVFKAIVAGIAPITEQGRFTPTGNIPLAPTANNSKPLPFMVTLELEEDLTQVSEADILDINQNMPGGAFGSGAIYTDSVKGTHIIRKVMLRMTAWLNFIMPY